jgi:nitroreductase
VPDQQFPLDLASVDHVLNTTRSVRLRLDLEREVPRGLIEEALTIALQAPTGANTQTWRFMVVTDPDLRAGLPSATARAPSSTSTTRRRCRAPGSARCASTPPTTCASSSAKRC